MEKNEKKKALLYGGVLVVCAVLTAAGLMTADFGPFEDAVGFCMDYVGVA